MRDDRAMESSSICNDAVARLASRGRFYFSDSAIERSCAKSSSAFVVYRGQRRTNLTKRGSRPRLRRFASDFAESEMAYFSRKYCAGGLRVEK